MSLTEKDKMMLIVLVIILIIGGGYILGIKPLMEQKKELAATSETAAADWTLLSGDIFSAFNSEYSAEAIYKNQNPTSREDAIDALWYNGNYKLGNQITNQMGAAVELSKIVDMQDYVQSAALLEDVKQDFFDDYVELYNLPSFAITSITESALLTEEELVAEAALGNTYEIDPVAFYIGSATFQFFCSSGSDISAYYDLLNHIEKCGYIYVNSTNIDVETRMGSITISVLMTPTDLSAYDVIIGSSGFYILADSVEDKYTT